MATWLVGVLNLVLFVLVVGDLFDGVVGLWRGGHYGGCVSSGRERRGTAGRWLSSLFIEYFPRPRNINIYLFVHFPRTRK